MADDTETYRLNDIGEQDFLVWKHHPVTKVVFRYLIDLERQLCEKQIAEMRLVDKTPDPFRLGMFQGRINTVGELAAIEFEHLMNFYPMDEPEE